MSADIEELRKLLNKKVRLHFRDGEIVEAKLLGVDPHEHEDLTYEVLRIFREGSPPPTGTATGATVVAPLAELERFETVAA